MNELFEKNMMINQQAHDLGADIVDSNGNVMEESLPVLM